MSDSSDWTNVTSSSGGGEEGEASDSPRTKAEATCCSRQSRTRNSNRMVQCEHRHTTWWIGTKKRREEEGQNERERERERERGRGERERDRDAIP